MIMPDANNFECFRSRANNAGVCAARKERVSIVTQMLRAMRASNRWTVASSLLEETSALRKKIQIANRRDEEVEQHVSAGATLLRTFH